MNLSTMFSIKPALQQNSLVRLLEKWELTCLVAFI